MTEAHTGHAVLGEFVVPGFEREFILQLTHLSHVVNFQKIKFQGRTVGLQASCDVPFDLSRHLIEFLCNFIAF